MSRGKEKRFRTCFIGVLCSNKKKAKNMLEGGAALSVNKSHAAPTRHEGGVSCAICSVSALSLFLIPTFWNCVYER
jgi:hypothetical protein